ncbi:hypothetical protein ACJO5Y_13645 [Marinobacter sp. GN3S48]|uniref:hypothetical protein n=1 Tax=Marinobacter sp. GN3S48 TaxID=3382302 RepID=UPI00387A996E
MEKTSQTGRNLARSLVLASLLASIGAQATSLAPEHEVRRLMLATEEAVAAENWGEAGEYLNRLQGLEGEKPVDYYYFRGRVMQESSHFNEAQSALEAYVSRAGSEGNHYRDALKRITAIEKSRKERASKDQNQVSKREPVAIIEPAGQQELANLRKLYLVDSDREALTIHLNSLLEVAGWRADQRVVRLDVPADVSYRIASGNSQIEVQESSREDDERITRNTQSINVYGISPQVEWDCQPSAGTCWVYDPRDGSRLLKLGPNRDRAEEIASTLGRLIKTLQAPG